MKMSLNAILDELKDDPLPENESAVAEEEEESKSAMRASKSKQTNLNDFVGANQGRKSARKSERGSKSKRKTKSYIEIPKTWLRNSNDSEFKSEKE